MAMSRALGGTLFTTLVADQDLAGGDLLQAGDHAQQRGLAAAGRTDQDDELAVVDGDVHAVDHLVAPEGLAHLPELDRSHVLSARASRTLA